MVQIFNPDALTELIEIDKELVPNLIEEFRTLAPTLIVSLQKSNEDQDFKTLALHSHSLKSSALLLGFRKMAEYCMNIELSAKKFSLEPESVAQLMPCYEEAIYEIDQYLAQLIAA